MVNYHELKKSLGKEDAEIFAQLEAAGWTILPEDFKSYWRSEELNESHGPLLDDEEAIRTARVLFEQMEKESGESSTPTQEEVIERIRTQPPAKQFSDHEIDLRDRVIAHLKEQGYEPQTNVECESGTADIVTDDAIYEIKCGLTPTNSVPFLEAIRQVSAYCNDINLSSDAVIVTCCSEDMEILKAMADEDKVHVVTYEELIAPPPTLTVGEQAAFCPYCNHEAHAPLPCRKVAIEGESTAVCHCGEKRGRQDDSFLVQQMLPSKMSTHPSLLMRYSLNQDYVKELAEFLKAGGHFKDPVDIFWDEEEQKNWVAEGNHRHAAGLLAGDEPLDINLHEGTLRDAIEFALKANAEHGLRLTDDDKRVKAVTILSDSEWFGMSDSFLASTVARGITQPFLGNVRGYLKEIVPAMQTDPSDENLNRLIDTLSIPAGLIRVVRRMPPERQEALFQNVLGDDGRRRGADNVVRSVPARAADKEQAETLPFSETPAFAEAEMSDKEAARVTGHMDGEVEETVGMNEEVEVRYGNKAWRVSPEVAARLKAIESRLAEIRLLGTKESTADCLTLQEERAELLGITEGLDLLDSDNFHVEKPVSIASLLALLKSESGGLDTDALIAQGFSLDLIQQAVKDFRVERLATGKCYYLWTIDDIVDEVRGRGVVSPGTFLQLGCQQSDLAEAERSGVVTRRADGWYVLPQEVSSPQAASESAEQIADDIKHGRETQPVEESAPATETKPLTIDDLKAVLKKHGKRSRLQLEEAGFPSSLINTAVASKAIAQPETGIFALRPSLEELLKGRDLRITYLLMGEMPGQVTVQVCVGDDIEATLMEVYDLARLRPLPDPVMEMIAKKAAHATRKPSARKPAAAPKTSSKKPSAAKKAAAKKAASRPAASKKTTKKAPTKSARA